MSYDTVCIAIDGGECKKVNRSAICVNSNSRSMGRVAIDRRIIYYGNDPLAYLWNCAPDKVHPVHDHGDRENIDQSVMFIMLKK